MGQGQAASVLLRAHSLTGRAEYLESARGALAPLLTDVEHGGVMRTIDGVGVLEEDPAELPAAVLNGWIFSLPTQRFFSQGAAFDGTGVPPTIRVPVLLAPWIGDPGHPVSTAELLLDLLPDARLALVGTPDDLRSLGDRVAAFLA